MNHSLTYSPVGLVLFLSVGMSAARGDDSADTLSVLKGWAKRASDIKTVQVHTTGNRTDHSPGFGEHGDTRRGRECMREIDYLSEAPHDVERYHRLSENLTEAGTKLCDFTVVREHGTNKRYIPGSHGVFDHDQIQYDRVGAEFDVEVSVIRWLLSKNSDNTNYFDPSGFKAGEQSRIVDDVQCAAVESTGDPKIRFWYEVSHPLRIRRIEFDIGHAEYQMRYEYRLRYDIPNQYDLPCALEFFDYKPHGRGIDAVVNCDNMQWKINESLPSDWSELPAPPGAVVIDYTTDPAKYFVQVSADSRKPLSEIDFGLHRFRIISSQIPGSRIEGKYSAHPSTDGHSRWWFTLGNCVLIVTGVVYMRGRYRDAQFPGGGSK